MASEQLELLDVEHAASFLGLSPSTLAKWRVTGGGPRFVKLGRRVAYVLTDLITWVRDQGRASTSEEQAKPARSATSREGLQPVSIPVRRRIRSRSLRPEGSVRVGG